jgi:hypothetical protein
MPRRLDDTRALTDRPSRGGESHHISTQKIDNGFLITRSVCTDTGDYKTQTLFSPSEPQVRTQVVGRPDKSGIVGNESAEDASKYLGRK